MAAPTPIRPGDEVVGSFVPITLAGKVYELRELLRHGDSWAHTFSRENGERFLQPHFASIERYDADGLTQHLLATVAEHEGPAAAQVGELVEAGGGLRPGKAEPQAAGTRRPVAVKA